MESWEGLFDRAEEYDLTLADIRRALVARRDD